MEAPSIRTPPKGTRWPKTHLSQVAITFLFVLLAAFAVWAPLWAVKNKVTLVMSAFKSFLMTTRLNLLNLTMSNLQPFGYYDPNLDYTYRRAAYAVIISGTNTVAAVKGRDKYWLPGGGSFPAESAEETIIREAREELGRSIRIFQETKSIFEFGQKGRKWQALV